MLTNASDEERPMTKLTGRRLIYQTFIRRSGQAVSQPFA